jgi:ferric-dicitrate binding protein FerR (iron transport regulator)
MNKRRWLLHIFERAHEPTPQEEERLQRAILGQVPDGRASRALLQGLDAPSSLAEQRLVASIADIPERHPRRWSLPVGLPTAGLLTASAAALVIGLVVEHGRSLQPEELAATLEEQSTPADLAPFPGVHLAYNSGYGELGGTTRSPEIQWISGQLEVEVEPHRGIQLAVVTEEATVRVIGTRFTVDRSDAHTVVGVARGKVEVTCSDGEQVYLTAGQQHSCASRSPSKLALRALRLRERGAEPTEVMSVVERGLGYAPEGEAAWDHLATLHMQALVDLGRGDEALIEAQAYLDDGHTRRRQEVLRLALSIAEQPCPLALDHQLQLQDEQASALDLVLLSSCLAPQQPQQARGLLERALEAPGLAVQDRAEVRQRLEQLR